MRLEKPLPQSGRVPPERAQLKVGFERFYEIAHELRYLSARQQAEVGENFEPYDPDWQRYMAMDGAGSVAVWTARTIESRVLVGYIIWITTRGLHCANTVFANADLVYITPEWRKGLTGYKLLKSGIKAIRPFVDFIRVETNDLYEDGRMGLLLKRLGLRQIGTVYQGHGKQQPDIQ